MASLVSLDYVALIQGQLEEGERLVQQRSVPCGHQAADSSESTGGRLSFRDRFLLSWSFCSSPSAHSAKTWPHTTS